MIVINKDKIISVLKDSLEKVKDKSKKVYTTLTDDICFIKGSQQFNVVKTNEKEKTNKPIFAMFDNNNLVMYFKEIDIIQKIKHIPLECVVKDSQNTLYKVSKIDENKVDYLLKTKKGYKTLSCYKIYLEEAI